MLDPKEEKVEGEINEPTENTSESKSKEESTSESESSEVEKATPETQEETTKAVEAIEDKVAEEAEKDDEKAVIPSKDYDKMELEELADELEKLLKGNPVQQIKTHAEGIKSAFNLKFGKLLAEKKEAFLAEGGNSIDFQFSSPVKTRYNKLLSDYKKQRDAYYSNLEKQLKENLEKRLQVIEDLKSLIENADTKTMYKSFRDLQNVWRSIGAVPKNKYNDTWRTYHHHVERFYDLLHLSNDFRDLDFKNNLEEKLKLIKKAEELSEENDINLAFKELQKLHKLWKEDIGPVAKEMREEVWQKFSEATKKIHDRRHEYFREMKSHYSEIIEKKLAVVEEINAFDFSKNTSHSDWQNSIKEIEALRQKYFDAGKLPYSKSEAVWQKFKTATKKFNQAKNTFYKQEKSSQQDNLKKKLALIELAESLKDSEDWVSATNTFKKIQADWKKIGHVPRKFSDDIWKKFKAACNHYFDRYHSQKNSLSIEQQEVVNQKVAFLEGLKEKDYTTKEAVSDLMNEWSNLGRLPRSARNIDAKFNKFVDKALSGMSLGKEEVAMLKFRNIVNGYLANNDIRKLDSEQLFIRKKIDESVREIQQLENNLSFISNATDDNPLVKNVRNSIAEFKQGLDVWKQKLSYLKTLDY
ncbi:DUF349 domain-containing protein [Pseudotenacibaculum sp. MALMAid0570]|uniref:DUF349 domain-containing protein n=1 Tax=Pseudotenacibaculum sp. MALMAid0570 TaxID=3143938 RepID=UPI0032DEEA77